VTTNIFEFLTVGNSNSVTFNGAPNRGRVG